MYPQKSNLVVFQPHLFSRTKDFMSEFAKALEKFDKIFLLDIYPAREEPIPGIDSRILLEKIQNKNKNIIADDELLNKIKKDNSEIIVHLAARTEVEQSFYEQISFSDINYTCLLYTSDAADE